MGSGNFFLPPPVPPFRPNTHNLCKVKQGQLWQISLIFRLQHRNKSWKYSHHSNCDLSVRFKIQHWREASAATYKIQGENGKQVRVCGFMVTCLLLLIQRKTNHCSSKSYSACDNLHSRARLFKA